MEWLLAPFFVGACLLFFWIGGEYRDAKREQEIDRKLDGIKKRAASLQIDIDGLSHTDLVDRVRGSRGIRGDQ